MTPGCALCAPVKGGCPALLEPGDRQPSPGARGGSTGGDGPPLPGVPPGTEPGWVLGSHASSPRGRAHILSKPWQGGRAAHPPPRSLPPTAHPAGSGRSPHHAPPAGPEPRGHASSWPGQHGPCSTALSARAGGGAQALGSQRPSRWPHPSPGRPSPPPDVGCVIAAPPPAPLPPRPAPSHQGRLAPGPGHPFAAPGAPAGLRGHSGWLSEDRRTAGAAVSGSPADGHPGPAPGSTGCRHSGAALEAGLRSPRSGWPGGHRAAWGGAALGAGGDTRDPRRPGLWPSGCRGRSSLTRAGRGGGFAGPSASAALIPENVSHKSFCTKLRDRWRNLPENLY